VALLGASTTAQSNTAVKVALIADKAFDLDKSPLVSLLEVKLSQKQGIQLLERAEIDKLLQEQQLSVAGLLQRHSAVKVGRLLRVDAFLLLSTEADKDQKQNGSKLLRVRLVETAHGLRLLDSFEEPDGAKLEDTVKRITEKVIAAVPKIMLPPGEAIPVGIVDIHRVQLSERYQWLARALPAMLSARLSKELRIIMLEREDLKILHDETLLTEGEDTEFWSSGVLIDGYLRPSRAKDIEMQLSLRQASGKEITGFTVLVEPNEPSVAIDKAATRIIPKLLNAPPSASWQPKQEAEEFFRQGQLLRSHKRHKDALPPLETAHALQPDCVFYTGAVFGNEWEARTLKKGSFYSDLELAEFVSLLVRCIQREHGKGLLSKSYVLQECGKTLGLATDIYGRLSGYFSKPASVTNNEIRHINRENRRIWTKTVKDAAEDWHGGIPIRRAILKYASWVSSDKPEEVMENLRETFAKFIMPPEMGGEVRQGGIRFMHARSALLHPSLNIFSVQALEKTHMGSSAQKFQKFWLQYLQDLAEVEDPIVRFAAYLALTEQQRWKDKYKAKHCCKTALKILQKDIANLDEAYSDFYIKSMRREMSKAIVYPVFDCEEAMTFFQKIYEPLIERSDAHNLALWGPGVHYRYCSNIDSARVSVRLLERIAKVLESHQHHDSEVKMSLNRVRDTLGELKNKLPQMRTLNEQAGFSVRILLRKGDWPHDATNFRYVRVFLQGNMLWVAFAEPAVGLVGIDLAQNKVVSMWQTNCGNGTAIFTGGKGRQISGSITGIAIREDVCYVAIRDIGLVRFPGNLRRGREFLRSPRILTEKNGLPSVSITGMTAVGSKLWIAYGSGGKESGLIIYDPKNGEFETVLCSTLKGNTPFSAGKSYEISSLTLGPDNNLFFIVLGRRDNWTKIREITGLWRINIHSRDLKFIWHDRFIRYFLESIEDTGESWWLRDLEFLCQFDPNSEVATFILGDPRTKAKADPIPVLKRGAFVPESSFSIGLGHLSWGHISLRTAAVYGNKLWARLGRSQIIIIHKGKGFEEAEVIDNNILNGGKVLRFFSTPYGLIALGEGTVGLIETRNNEK